MLVEHVCSYRPAPHMFAVFTERSGNVLYYAMVMMSTQRLFMLCSVVYDACINVCGSKFSARATKYNQYKNTPRVLYDTKNC